MGKKGQVVIPKRVRDLLGVTGNAKFIVFARGDLIVLKRLVLPDLGKEWQSIFEAMDRKGLRMGERDVAREVRASRRERARRARQGGDG